MAATPWLRGIASRIPVTRALEAETTLARRLLESPLYSDEKRKKLGRRVSRIFKPPEPGGLPRRETQSERTLHGTGDKARVNIVSESLCDDVLKTIGPSLERHKECDLIDLFPGAGLWSQKMHDFLQPRSHILMEPDDVYKPFLQPLLDKPNTKLIPKSGIVWNHLNGILTPEHLPHQTEILIDPAVAPQRNDTLLVIANLSWAPPRKFGHFDSISQLLLYQFMAATRSSSLFQKYGLVRMLIWVPPGDKSSLCPRSLQRRRRMAVEAELGTAWITEVTQPPDDVSPGYYGRDHSLDVESGLNVLVRMHASGIPLPPEKRQSAALKELLREGTASGQNVKRRFEEESRELQAQLAAGEFDETSPLFRRLRSLRYRTNVEDKIAMTTESLFAERDRLIKDILEGRADPAEREVREKAWNDRVSGMPLRNRQAFLFSLHGAHLLRQNPPVMSWDRRAFEPMIVQPKEFIPNEPCCLLDIQPKALHPYLRSIGKANDNAGDYFELLLRSMMHNPSQPVGLALDDCWPGAAEELLPKCPSLRDPSKGGSVLGGPHGELCVRMLNEHQLVEIMEAWMKWPFRPTFRELLGRIGDDISKEYEPEEPDQPQIIM